jgi:hypothetical protein
MCRYYIIVNKSLLCFDYLYYVFLYTQGFCNTTGMSHLKIIYLLLAAQLVFNCESQANQSHARCQEYLLPTCEHTHIPISVTKLLFT